MHELKRIQEEIGDWHKQKFGETTDDLISAIMEKIGEECEELGDAHCFDNPTDKKTTLPNECADVAIVLMAYCDRVGIDLEEAILKKMRVNWCREWKKIDWKYVRDKTS
jgi:NTP pyrophosphatase (non-canonical NTP hydrolase)